MSTTASIKWFDGIPITIPNKVIDASGFYISYNDYDISAYGSDTTALVKDNYSIGKGDNFYILNGDHRQEYIKLIPLGFNACIEYFKTNSDLINKHSERI